MTIFLILIALILVPLALYYFSPRSLFLWARNRLRARGGLVARSVRVGAHDWPYLEGGSLSAPPLLLVHGFGGDKDNWAMIAPFLSKNYRLIVPDLLGFGENAHDSEAAYDIKSQCERLVDFMDALGIACCHVAGNSMGGWIALQLALDWKERVNTLTLVNNAGVQGNQKSELEKMLSEQAVLAARMRDYATNDATGDATGDATDEKGTNNPKAVLATHSDFGPSPLVARDVKDMRRLMAFIAHKPPFIPNKFLAVAFETHTMHNALYNNIFWTISVEFQQNTLAARLHEIKVPTLIIWGRHDKLIHVSCVAELEAGIETAESIIFEDAAHVPMIEKPRDMAAALCSFLARHANKTRDPNKTHDAIKQSVTAI